MTKAVPALGLHEFILDGGHEGEAVIDVDSICLAEESRNIFSHCCGIGACFGGSTHGRDPFVWILGVGCKGHVDRSWDVNRLKADHDVAAGPAFRKIF